MHQTIPMLFDQSDVDIGFAHRSDFCGHFGAAWHKEVALFEFLQPRARSKPNKRAPYPFTKRTGKSMKSTVYPDHPAPVLALRTVTYCTEKQETPTTPSWSDRAGSSSRCYAETTERATRSVTHQMNAAKCAPGPAGVRLLTSRRSTSSCYNWPKWPSPMRRTTLCWWVGRAPARATSRPPSAWRASRKHGKRVRFYSTVDLVNALERRRRKAGRAHRQPTCCVWTRWSWTRWGICPSARWRGAAVPPALQTVRAHQRGGDDEPGLRRMEQRVRGSEDDHCVAGPAHAPLPHRGDG